MRGARIRPTSRRQLVRTIASLRKQLDMKNGAVRALADENARLRLRIAAARDRGLDL